MEKHHAIRRVTEQVDRQIADTTRRVAEQIDKEVTDAIRRVAGMDELKGLGMGIVDTIELDRQIQERLVAGERETELNRRVAIATSFGEDNYESGTVIRFTKRHGPVGAPYTYAAIKASKMWYLSSGDAGRHPARTWKQLLAWLVGGVFPTETIEVLDNRPFRVLGLQIVDPAVLDMQAGVPTDTRRMELLSEHLDQGHHAPIAGLSLQGAERMHSGLHAAPGGADHAHQPGTDPLPLSAWGPQDDLDRINRIRASLEPPF